ncbi:metallopeptidase family protein [Candidatus Acetothermia bacterium]|jgi:predicted Zn-dependent protease with MMP-like domain|nr:metallopeptidase family protein [Candidatus Acetothermia bacterium]MCI2432023.1 metallopeptidase family protein [Candidatus Acetothermia bacterium]MCI2436820.1 metallopeptidase family protein [Candidatus Acetothermia bacterium]
MTRSQFEELVHETLHALPAFFRRRLQNVLIIVQDAPDPEIARELGDDLLGLYHGTPLTERSVFHERLEPDIIYIYQKNIESLADSEEEVRRQVRITVIHEIGHYFGLDEAQLEILESYAHPD